MKTFMKRALCLGLVLLMLLPCIVACKKDQKDEGESESISDVVDTDSKADDTENTDTESETETESEENTDGEENESADTDEDTVDTEEDTESEEISDVEDTETEVETEENKYEVYDDLADINLGGRRVVIAQSGIDDYQNEICVDRMTGDVVNDAIFKRTQRVEQRLNVDIANQFFGNGVYSVLTNLEAGIISGELTYDFIHNPVYSTCAYTTKGLYRDINKINNIDLDKVYWSTFVNDALEIGGVQYVASGAISLSFYKFTFITVVNNRMLEQTEGGAPDLTQVVKSGKWTLEYQKNLTKQFYSDVGAPGKSEDDTFGFVTSTDSCVDPYVSSGEIKILEKDANGYYSWAFDLAHASNVMDKIIDLYCQDSTYCVTGTDKWGAISDKFASGAALMATLRFHELESASVRAMKDEYTILPIPRYSDDQDGYYSLIADRFTGIAVPVSVSDDDVEDMGAIIEAMASESYRTVTPAYYEVVLKTRYTSDSNGWEMIDMIFENVKMDAVLPYTAALELEGDSRETIIKKWRWVVYRSYSAGTTSEMASTFNETVGTRINEKLNGEAGLQTYIRDQISKQ